MGLINSELEEALEKGPDERANALQRWRMRTLERQQFEAILAGKFRLEFTDKTSSEIKEMVMGDKNRYDFCVNEIKAEADYERLHERLLANKKRADLRTAF